MTAEDLQLDLKKKMETINKLRAEKEDRKIKGKRLYELIKNYEEEFKASPELFLDGIDNDVLYILSLVKIYLEGTI